VDSAIRPAPIAERRVSHRVDELHKDPSGSRHNPSPRVYPDALLANPYACRITLLGEQGAAKILAWFMGENEFDERESQSEGEAEKRDFAATERDQKAAERDAAADLRDEIADERDKIADARDAELEKTERQVDEPAESLGLSPAHFPEGTAFAARRRADASTLRDAADHARWERNIERRAENEARKNVEKRRKSHNDS
jgi:hypothetical protein